MKYAILTLGNPEREPHRQRIREAMANDEEVFPKCIDGKNAELLRDQIDRWGFRVEEQAWRPGELGLWYSNINAWNLCYNLKEPLLVFEDDALPRDNFRAVVEATEPPPGYDFVTYYTPLRNQFQQNFFRLHRTSQEHGNICIQYSPEGAGHILDLLSANKLEWPVDIWLFKQNKFFNTLNGFGPKPTSHVIIDHDFDVPTNIHEDERITVDAL